MFNTDRVLCDQRSPSAAVTVDAPPDSKPAAVPESIMGRSGPADGNSIPMGTLLSGGPYDVIYARYSDPKQREESIDSQINQCTHRLKEMGIGNENLIVLTDSAIRGDLEDRPAYQTLLELITRGKVRLLMVDQQSRLSRGGNAKQLVTDLVFQGGRFIAIADGVDTARTGWSTLVGIKEIQSDEEILSISWRVRRAQEQRVRFGNGSAGDFPFGYGSVFDDPEAWAKYNGRGPKPTKHVVVESVSADIVRTVYRLFVEDRMSLSSIVRELNNKGDSIPRVGAGAWEYSHVHRILANPKYHGDWCWGCTTTLRDSKGRRKQVSASGDKHSVRVDRPSLRIISDEQWYAAQALLNKHKETYGPKPGQKRRGPAEHYKKSRPRTLLGGLMTCAVCGGPLSTQGLAGNKMLGCRNHKHGICGVVTKVPIAETQQKLLSTISEVFNHWPEWLELAVSEMRQAITTSSQSIPQKVGRLQQQLVGLEKEIERYADAIAQGSNSPTLSRRLNESEVRYASLQQQLRMFDSSRKVSIEFPPDEWLREQLRDWASLITESVPESAAALREILREVVATEVKIPGKRRGYSKVSFRINGAGLIAKLLGSRLSPAVASLIVDSTSNSNQLSERFEITIGGPTRMDILAPQILAMRRDRVPWREITRRTGVNMGNAYTVYMRAVKAEEAKH